MQKKTLSGWVIRLGSVALIIAGIIYLVNSLSGNNLPSQGTTPIPETFYGPNPEGPWIREDSIRAYICYRMDKLPEEN